jgi:hypothetical protein
LRHWWPHFANGWRGFRHILMVMNDMWNKEVLYSQNFCLSPTRTEMLRGELSTLYISDMHWEKGQRFCFCPATVNYPPIHELRQNSPTKH